MDGERSVKAVQVERPAVHTLAALMHVKLIHKCVNLIIQHTSHSDFFLLLVLSGPCCAGLRPEHHLMAAAGSVGSLCNQQGYLKLELTSFSFLKLKSQILINN